MKKFLVLSGLLVLFFSFGVFAYSNPSTNWQVQQPSFNTLYSGDMGNYWPILNDMQNGQCDATTDFVVGIPPGGCSPAVVTSDLLAEQNVPVFCQLYAIKVNPLIKVSSIKTISFKGDYPEGVRSVVFHPARAAVKSYSTLLGDPVLNNIGYVVIILKQEKVEANMEKWIAGNLTATIKYDVEDVYGTGKGEYYLQDMSENDWNSEAVVSSFWNGRGYLRASEIENGKAKVEILDAGMDVIRNFNLKVGETSAISYLPGFYCRAGLKVKLNKIVGPEDMALLNVDGEEVWVREGSSFLNGKCSVKRLDVRSNNDGSVEVRCSGAGKAVTLELKGKGAQFRITKSGNTEDVGVKVGANVVGDWYLAYVGKYPKGFDEKEGEIAILIKGGEDVGLVYSAVQKVAGESGDFKAKVQELVRDSKGKERAIKVLVVDQSESGAKFLSADESLTEKGVGAIADEYFDKSVDVVVNELLADYRLEEQENGEPYGEGELWEEIVLAGKLGKFKSQDELMDRFVKTYPLSPIVDEVRKMRQKLGGADFSKSFASIYVGDSFKSISVVDFKVADEGVRKVDLRVGSILKNNLTEIGEADFANNVNGIDLKEKRRVEVKEILPGEVKLYFKSEKEGVRSKTSTIKEGERYFFDGIEIYVDNIEIDEVAFVSLIPEVKHTDSEANFSFKIGIEKRAIELSPEKTKRMLANLNKSIAKWEDTVERLGNVIKGLKGACFATSAILMIKNMASGFSGEAMARQKVMEQYRVECATNYAEMTKTECYNELEPKIEAAVVEMTAMYNAANEKMSSAREGNVEDSGGLFGGEAVVDNQKFRKSLVDEIGAGTVVNIDVGGNEKIPVTVDDSLSVSQLQAIILWEEAEGKSSVPRDVAKAEMDAALRNVALAVKQKEEANLAVLELEKMTGEKGANVQSYISKDAVLLKWDGDEEKGEKIQYLEYDGEIYKLLLAGVIGGNLGVRDVQEYKQPASRWTSIAIENRPKGIDKIVFSSAVTGSCSNVWKSTPEVKYYELGDNKGLPAIVPFDLKDGWYVWVKNSGGTFTDDSVQGYKASGDVRNFYICNVGSNGLMQTGAGDDLCQNFDVNSIGKVDVFQPCPKMAEKDIGLIYEKAREAIRRASQQYGQKSVNIFDKMIEVGKPMSQVGGFECQDFMSASECKLMFNVCDPVICPPSRCNFGGAIPVADVIQTGVIGSLVLCLPNSRDGVLIPICLSGVHAGLDAYLSVLKSERDCLEHNLETGELVGICDEITAIYKCEFFWRQLSPVMDQLIPGIVQRMMAPSQGVRGGGEYALVQHSWNVMKQSVSYFKDTYAQNAFRAFNIRSTQEVGSTFCKAFVGTSVPSSASIIDSLLEPESPNQFYAQFSEKVFSEATVPATSQYKVYFHIYAGKDQGAQYKVYLKDPPETSYYKSNPTINVRDGSGYIPVGESVDRSIDFTAPSGYKELCVVVNAREECGFKQSTTDFGINWVKDKYIEDQVNDDDIRTEKDCISGTPSALSLVNLNLQAGVSEMVEPEIAMRGIVRICASENPEAGVSVSDEVYCSDETPLDNSEYQTGQGCAKGFVCDGAKCVGKDGDGNEVIQKVGSRWQDVGYCGNVNMRCWLDSESVKDSLERLEALDGATNDVLNKRRDWIENERLGLEAVQELLSGARGRIKALMFGDLDASNGLSEKVKGIIGDLDSVIGISNLDEAYSENVVGAGTNNDRAEALALKASVWRMIVGANIAKGEVVEEVRTHWEDYWPKGEGEEGDYAEGSTEFGFEVDREDVSCDLYCEHSGYGSSSVEMTDLECEKRGGVFDYEVEGGCCCYKEKGFFENLFDGDWFSFGGGSEGEEEVIVTEDIVDEVVDEDEVEAIKDYIVPWEGKENGVYEINGEEHIGIGHKITSESRDIFQELFGCGDVCFNELIRKESDLTDIQVLELFDYDIDIYVKRTRELFSEYDSYPVYVKMALVSAVYRGEMKDWHKTVALINGGRWAEVPAEYLDNNEYRTTSLMGVVDRMNSNAELFWNYAVNDLGLANKMIRPVYR